MSLDVKGFSEFTQGGVVQIDIPHNHRRKCNNLGSISILDP